MRRRPKRPALSAEGNLTTMSKTPQQPPRRRRIVLGAACVGAVLMALTMQPVAAKQDKVRTSDIAKKAVTAPKLAKQAVKTGKIREGAVTTAKIRDGAIAPGKIAPGAVGQAALADDLVPRWAVVWGGPTIVRGHGAVSVAYQGLNWQYRLRFDRDISGCSTTATLSGASAGDPEQTGMISVAPYAGDPNAVLVVTRDHDGVGDPRGFTVQILC